jgi:hypothetical protein
MPHRYAFLIGNGLSSSFDARLSSRAISERVFKRLADSEQAALLELAGLLAPETPDPPIGVDRGSFEALAGPVDRMAAALLALDGLLGAASLRGLLAALQVASHELRVIYRKIVGLVLEEIDACCVVDGTTSEERRSSWERLNGFVASLMSKSGDCHPLFTTNYDSLLISSMLDARGEVFDGFPGGTLDYSLRCWGSKPAIYHLHGSIGWVSDHGGLAKLEMDALRTQGLVQQWAAGEPVDRYPTVILGDQKTRTAERYPFNIFYAGFRNELAKSTSLVTVGYSFGDRPISEIVARFLAEDHARTLHVWKREGEASLFLTRLRSYLPAEMAIKGSQVFFQAVTLPDLAAVSALP